MKLSLRKCLRLQKKSDSVSKRHHRNWADLPIELLGLILEKLVLLPDYIRFGAVCKRWYSAVRYNYQGRCRTCNQEPPMILLPPPLREKRRCLYSISERRIYSQPLTVPYSRTCTKKFCGSSYGWLTVAYKDCYIKLFNPFSRNTIRLPIIRYASVAKCTVTLSCDPDLNPNDWVAVAIYEWECRLAIIRAGDDSWYNISYPQKEVIAAGFFKGHLYVMGRARELWQIAIQDEADFGLVKMEERLTKIDVETFRCKFYLVELKGDLLVVCRIYDSRVEGLFPKKGRTVGFRVYKLCLKEKQLSTVDSDDKHAEWIEMNDLGQFCLFLGMNKPICISTATFPACRPNCIYYTDETSKNYLYNLHTSGDMGVFDLAIGDISSFYGIPASQPRISSAFWISPNLC